MRKLRRKKFDDDLSLIRKMIGRLDYAVARGGLISILKSDPFHAEALRMSSLLCATEGDFPEALASAVVLTTVEPKVARHWVLRGELEFEVRFKHAAIRSFNEAAELGFAVDKVMPTARQLSALADTAEADPSLSEPLCAARPDDDPARRKFNFY